MSCLAIAAATISWFATGYLGWLNADAYFRRTYGSGAPEMLHSVAFGPFNCVTFFLWGNNLRRVVPK